MKHCSKMKTKHEGTIRTRPNKISLDVSSVGEVLA